MTSRNPVLPPFRVVEAALRTTTERLVREVAQPQDGPPDWSEFEWAVARAVCAMQGISGLLAKRLRWQGPKSFSDFLDDQQTHMRVCHAHIGQLLGKLDTAFFNAGIAYLPLKGSAIRAIGLYEPGERPQGDIDLLLDAPDLPACAGLLEKLGYHWLFSARRHEVYAPATQTQSHHFGEHSDNALKIELHTKVAEALPVEQVDITSSLFPVHRLPGGNRYASLAALTRHTGLHAAGNMRAHALRFIQIYEVAQLARRMTDADWCELLGADLQRSMAWWLFPPLALAARYLPGSVPAQRLAELRAVCPRRLRAHYEKVSLYEVSWSNLRIAALPGMEWSRTLAQTLQLARSRLYPSRLARDELAFGGAVQPQFQQVRWYGAPHAERIVRWLLARPPRVQTITAVRAALQSA